MRALDLLDRRALAQLRPIDVYGRLAGPVQVCTPGLTAIGKSDGTLAIIAADGFADYASSLATPASPAIGSVVVPVNLRPMTGEACPRQFALKLPRDPAPANADKDNSVFRSADVDMLPGAQVRLTGSACAVRVAVRRKSDKKVIEGALVRARSDDLQFNARGLTDARGEAVLVFPSLPLAFAGAGANLQPETAARVVVTVDPAAARFNDPNAGPGSLATTTAFVDPDAIGATAADFASGAAITIAAGREVAVAIDWTKP